MKHVGQKSQQMMEASELDRFDEIRGMKYGQGCCYMVKSHLNIHVVIGEEKK